MSDRPPLPSHLVIYPHPDPQKWIHLKTQGEYEIVGECWIESLGVEGFLYRRTDPNHPAVIDRAKTEFLDGRFAKGRLEEPEDRRTLSYTDTLGNLIYINMDKGTMDIKHHSGAEISIDANGTLTSTAKVIHRS